MAIYGTSGDDEIHANGWLEEIWGLGGDDTIYAGWSHNDVIGGSGDDVLYGESGSDALYGQEDDDTLYGGDHQDFLYGQDGDDILNGGSGAFSDGMEGGRGNDIYYVDYVGDSVDEVAGESDGIDRVRASIDYTLPDRVENLTLLQGAGAIDGTGNELDNEITGNSSSNTLIGLDGSDTLDGGGGADDMRGGRGNDYYYVDNAGDEVTESEDEGIDTVYSTVSFTLGDNVEDLGLTGTGEIDGTGNELNNTIAGNGNDNVLRGLDGEDVLKGGGGDDTLRGGDENDELHGQAGNDILRGDAGDDKMYGGIGDDTYFPNSNGDELVEYAGEGRDTVFVSGFEGYTLAANFEDLVLMGTEAGIGNGAGNTITGDGGDNFIDGRGGQDTMEGRQGDDLYIVDQGNDIVREFAGQGNDTVRTSVNYTLSAGVEVETLTTTVDYGTAAIELTGNEFANTLIGNDGGNRLRGRGGSDVIDGRGGIDTVNYFDSTAGAIVILGQNGAPGQAYQFALINNAPVLVAVDTLLNIENVEGSSESDTLVGNELVNLLTGFAGNDIYVVQNGGDRIIEGAGQGADELRTSVTYTLAAVNADIETFRTTEEAGTAPINLTGNGIANLIVGNAGNNVINGGGGADRIIGARGVDTLVGGSEADTFIWRETNETGTEANFADVITDFNFKAGDRIDLSQIDANLVDADNQEFEFIGQDPFTLNTATPDPSDVVPGEIRYVHANGDTLLLLQTGTSPDVEAVIRIAGIVTPEASWFVL